MSEKVDVYLPLFVGDYLADTTDLTAEEHGVYLLLLMNLWKREGRLPCEPARLARMAGLSLDRWEAVWMTISRFFAFEDGQLIQGRLTREIDRAKARKQAASENGRLGGLAKAKQTSSNPTGKTPSEPPSEQPSKLVTVSASSSPSSSPSSSSSPKPSSSPKGEIARVRARPAADAPSQEPQNLHSHLLASFCALWQERYGEPYAPTPGDRAQLGRLLNGPPRLPRERADELPTCFRNYLADEEPFVAQKQRHSLIFFCTSGGANKYRVTAAVLTEKEARGKAAAAQWLGHHREKQHAGT